MSINIEEFYTPNEVIRMGVLKGENLDTRRQRILRHIREGKIKYKNVGTEAKPRYMIRGIHLQEYLNNQK